MHIASIVMGMSCKNAIHILTTFVSSNISRGIQVISNPVHTSNSEWVVMTGKCLFSSIPGEWNPWLQYYSSVCSVFGQILSMWLSLRYHCMFNNIAHWLLFLCLVPLSVMCAVPASLPAKWFTLLFYGTLARLAYLYIIILRGAWKKCGHRIF